MQYALQFVTSFVCTKMKLTDKYEINVLYCQCPYLWYDIGHHIWCSKYPLFLPVTQVFSTH